MKGATLKKAEIVKVRIRVGGKEIEVTPDEARELRQELEKLDGRPVPAVVPYVPYRWRDYDPPWGPVWVGASDSSAGNPNQFVAVNTTTTKEIAPFTLS